MDKFIKKNELENKVSLLWIKWKVFETW